MKYSDGSTTPSKSLNPEEPDNETLDFTKPDFEFIPKGDCQYRQQGPYLVCQSCLLKHAVWIGMEKIMVGMENGKPVLKNRLEVSQGVKPSETFSRTEST